MCGRRKGGAVSTEDQRRYLSYLLRLWEIEDDVRPAWRASLESPQTGECHGFSDLKALFAFLEQKTAFIVNLDDSEGGPL